MKAPVAMPAFQGCLAKNRGSTSEERRFWRDGVYDQIREVMPLQGGSSIERICELARVSRASFYRSPKEQEPAEEEAEVRSTIQQIALEQHSLLFLPAPSRPFLCSFGGLLS
jgi:hypothetical protein